MKFIKTILIVALYGAAVGGVSCHRNTPSVNSPSLNERGAVTELSCFPGLSLKMDRAASTQSSFFPAGKLDSRPQAEQFVVEWYSEHLKAMAEPSLLTLSGVQIECYRFLWLRSFHHPVAVRIWREGNDRFIVAKELDGAGGYEPGRLVINQVHSIIYEADAGVKLKK
ncbi:MAG TPA: hypothetical protein VFD58_06540 [Blastocatellia bacterium]|nr:hypothetical protein [Blastocatellia bacterium]